MIRLNTFCPSQKLSLYSIFEKTMFDLDFLKMGNQSNKESVEFTIPREDLTYLVEKTQVEKETIQVLLSMIIVWRNFGEQFRLGTLAS